MERGSGPVNIDAFRQRLLSSFRVLGPGVRAVAQGTFNFSDLEHLMAVSDQDEGEDEA